MEQTVAICGPLSSISESLSNRLAFVVSPGTVMLTLTEPLPSLLVEAMKSLLMAIWHAVRRNRLLQLQGPE